jgi:hypothetical protein
VVFDPASEDESERKSVVAKRTCDNPDEVRNHFFIVTLVEGIYDDDHRKSRHNHRLNGFNDQFSELAFERSMHDMMIPLQRAFDVWSRGWDGECKMICNCRYEMGDSASASSPSQEK